MVQHASTFRKRVVRVMFTNPEKPHSVGGNWVGDVSRGRMRLTDGTRKHVMIKQFRALFFWAQKQGISEKRFAAGYNHVIRKLVRSGVSLPKMGMFFMPTKKSPKGEWVLLSQPFYSQKSSKIESGSYGVFSTPHQRSEGIVLFTKIANSGFLPIADIIEPFKDSRKGVIPIDIDLLVVQYFELRKNRSQNEPEKIAWFLLDRIMGMCGGDKAEFKRLLQLATVHSNEPIRKHLLRIKTN